MTVEVQSYGNVFTLLIHYKFIHGTTYFHRSCTTNFFFVAIKCQFFSLSKMDPNQYNYQCYYNYLQNQSLPTNENSQNPSQYIMYRPPKSSKKFQNPPQYVMCPPPPPTSENSQNPLQYIMYPPPPHIWYMHLSLNVEPPTSGSWLDDS